MIIKIHSSQSVSQTLNYNENKVNQGVAQVLYTHNCFSTINTELDFTDPNQIMNIETTTQNDRYNSLYSNCKLNTRVKNKVFSVSINPVEADTKNISDHDFVIIANDYMQQMVR